MSKGVITLTSKSPEETRAIGERLGKLAEPGDIYILTGKLGAGKTVLTQGIALGLGITDCVLSPTFVLMRELNKGRLPLYHIDLYRLDRIEEVSDLGLDDYLFGRGLCVIEWAEKGLSVLPAGHLLIKIDYLSDTERSFEFIPHGKRYEKLLSKLKHLSFSRR